MVAKLVQQKKPRLGKDAPRLKFCVRLALQLSQPPQVFQYPVGGGAAPPDDVNLYLPVLDNRVQVFALKAALKVPA